MVLTQESGLSRCQFKTKIRYLLWWWDCIIHDHIDRIWMCGFSQHIEMTIRIDGLSIIIISTLGFTNLMVKLA